MHIHIDDTFRKRLNQLQNHEQKAVKTSVFYLVFDRRIRALDFKKRSDGYWSARANLDIRIIMDWNEEESEMTLRYVDHHKSANAWADRHKTKTRAGNDATEAAETTQPAQETAPHAPAMQQKKTIRLTLLSYAESAVRACLNPLDTLHVAIENARDRQHEQSEQLPGKNGKFPKGVAEVLKLYEISHVGKVAGCHVLEGKIACEDQIRIIRGGMAIHQGKIDSLKHFRENVQEVQKGYECGIGVWSYPNIQVGDRIESY